MFRWLFKRRGRLLYSYWAGNDRGWVRDDPLAILKRLVEDKELRLDTHPKAAEMGDDKAQYIVLRATCRAFNVTDYDPRTGNGMTILELSMLFNDFGAFMDMLKKNTSSSQMRPRSTDAISKDWNKPTTPATAA